MQYFWEIGALVTVLTFAGIPALFGVGCVVYYIANLFYTIVRNVVHNQSTEKSALEFINKF